MEDDAENRAAVDAALAKLGDADQARFLRDLDTWNLTRDALHMATERGVRVAPLYGRPRAEQMRHEAQRRTALGDPTAAVWAALAGVSDDSDG